MKQEVMCQLEAVPLIAEEQERLGVLIEIIVRMEGLTGAPAPSAFPLRQSLAVFDEQNILGMAALARAHFQAGDLPILDFVATCETSGLRVISTPMDKSVNGFFVDVSGTGVFIFLNALDTAERKIFSLAHELGALIFGGKGVGADLLQRVATAFAAYFLMPENSVRRSLSAFGFSDKHALSFEMLLNLKSRFGVSAEAFLKRVSHLKIISKKNHNALSEELAVHYRKTNFQEPWLKGHLPQLSENVRLFNMTALAASQKKIGRTEAAAILEKFGW